MIEVLHCEFVYLWYYFDVQLRLMKNIGRNIRATGLYFLFGIFLSAVFQRYVPEDLMTTFFGGNEAFGVLMAATIGVPLYACGGGTIPLLQTWLTDGRSSGFLRCSIYKYLYCLFLYIYVSLCFTENIYSSIRIISIICRVYQQIFVLD